MPQIEAGRSIVEKVGNSTILDLCGGTGAWSQPYREADYKVIVVDPYGETRDTVNIDVRDFQTLNSSIQGVLAAPPCTEFSASGARWWKGKDPKLLSEAIAVVRACLEIVRRANPVWWCLENPVGRIYKCVPELGKPIMRFDPCDFGDPYTKRTCLYGRFSFPEKSPVYPVEGSKIHLMSPSPTRTRDRSITPSGFAKAFFRANP